MNVSKRAVLTVMLAIAFVCTLVIGTLVLTEHSNIAYAVGEAGSTATLSTNTDTVKRGSTVDVKVTLPMPADIAGNDDYYWNAVALTIGPLTADKSAFDTELAKELSVATGADGKMLLDYGDLKVKFEEDGDVYTCYQTSTTGDYFTKPSNIGAGFFYWSFGISDEVIDTSTGAPFSDMVYHGTLELTVTINVPDTFSVDDVTFGVAKMGQEKVGIGCISKKNQEEVELNPFGVVGKAPLTVTEKSIQIVTAATETNLTAINVGHGTTFPTDENELSKCDYPTEAPAEGANKTTEYDCEHFELFPLVLQPVIADDTIGATIKFGWDSATVAASGTTLGEDGWLSLEKPEDSVDTSKLYIYVQSEDYDQAAGKGKTQIYELTFKSSYVGLETLVFKDYSVMANAVDGDKTTAPTKVGLVSVPDAGETETAITFDPEVLNYKYYLLSDSIKTEGDMNLTLSLTATVKADLGLSTSIAVEEVIAESETASLTVPATATSGTEFDVAAPTASATYQIKLTVSKDGDATVKKEYMISLQVINCDDSLTLQAKGKSGAAPYDSSELKAQQNSVDFYFALNKETEEKADLLYMIANNATLALYLNETGSPLAFTSGENIDLALGKHKIVVSAEAGNTKTYTFILAMPDVLSLSLESNYQFLYVKSANDTTYRTAYGEDNLIHGKDDKAGNELGITRYILGQILPVTTIKTFIENNIDATQHEILWLYDQNDRLIYSCGAVDSAYENDYDATYFPVGTGWRVELKANASATPIDTVYLSVLGDVNCDGIINAFDTSLMNTQIIAGAPFDKLEVQLATTVYYTKENILSGNSVSAVNDVIRGDAEIDATFFKPNATPDVPVE